MQLFSDVRYALRGFARSPGFAIAAVLTLALGIGANTAIFSVADTILLRPLPYPNSERMAIVWDQLLKIGVERYPLSAQSFRLYKTEDRVFEAAAAFTQQERNLTGAGDAERLSILSAGEGLFSMTGASPAIGRAFTTDEYQPGHDHSVILSHALFVRKFGGDAAIVGKSIRLDDQSYTVAGVMPAEFEFSLGGGVDAFVPLGLGNDPHFGSLRMLARLRPGVSIAAAQSALDAIAKHYDETERPYRGPNGEDPGFHVKILSLREQLFGNFRAATWILLCSVAAVLLIACANVANLLLVRAVAREKETAMRRALGASNIRLMRQWITEAGVLAFIGGAIGSIAAIWGVRALVALSPSSLPAAVKINVDFRTLLFAVLISAVVCLLFGLAPAISTTSDIYGATRTPRRRVAPVLVASEVALATMLLIGAGLLLKSFVSLSRVNGGFNAEHVLTMRVQLPSARYPDARRRSQFFTELQQQLASLPGVTAAGSAGYLPAVGNATNVRSGNPFSIEGRPWNPNGAVRQVAHTPPADAGYFRAMQIPLLAGRMFTDADTAQSQAVTVVSETLARGFFPNGAIGQHIMLGAPRGGYPWLTIVGVVGDVKAALDQDPMPMFYPPVAQDGPSGLSIVVRATGDPMTMSRAATGVVRLLDPELAAYDVIPMEDRVARSIGQPRFETVIVAFFAAAALLLASVGIFGVVAHSTAQRTREIGIRMALGADRRRVIEGVLVDGLRPVAAGIVIGIAGSLVLGRLIAGALFHVTPNDPAIFMLGAVALAVVATAACLFPARKAARVDPAIALRAE